MTNPSTEFDTPWKEVLETYFFDFMMFYFPDAHRGIDWSRGFEFLDTELQQVVRDASLGKRLVDKLVKIYRHGGEEAWVLIHIEVQSQQETDFASRMYVYNYRIYDRYRRSVASLAVLGDESITWRPEQFGYDLFGCFVNFQFPIVKLLDYQQTWSELESSYNPFATVTMAHLKALETRQNRKKRKEWKLTITKRLYERGYQREDIINLFRFIDWVMSLPQELEQQFQQELSQFEEEKRMPYVTSFERMGIQKGIEQGIEQGIKQGQVSIVMRLLNRKFGELDPLIKVQIGQLDSTKLEQLTDALLDFQQVEELTTWLSNHQNL